MAKAPRKPKMGKGKVTPEKVQKFQSDIKEYKAKKDAIAKEKDAAKKAKADLKKLRTTLRGL